MFSFLRAGAEIRVPRVFIDVQNRCTVRYSRLGVCNVEREASLASVLAIPYRAYPY